MLNELWAGLIGAGTAFRLLRLYFIGLVYSYPFAMGTRMVQQISPRGSYTLLKGEKGKECVSPNNGNSYIIYPQSSIASKPEIFSSLIRLHCAYFIYFSDLQLHRC